jgi:hypothetical protein
MGPKNNAPSHREAIMNEIASLAVLLGGLALMSEIVGKVIN